MVVFLIIAFTVLGIMIIALCQPNLTSSDAIKQYGERTQETTKYKSTNTNRLEDIIKCPKCNSTQITSNSKNFSLGKAVGGVVLLGGVGALGGFIGNKKVIITCLKCGHNWKAGR